MCIRHPGWTNVILVVSYGMFGIVYLTAKQGWHAETALYVVVQIITTIGFGDITVTKEEEVFMIVFVLLGTVLVAKIVNDVSEIFLERASEQVDDTLHRMEDMLFTHGHRHHICPAKLHNLISAVLILGAFLLVWTLFFGLYEHCTCSYGYTAVQGCVDERCTETGGTTKTLLDALYMAVITYAGHQSGSIGSVLMVLGVVAFFNVISAVAEVIAGYQRYHKNRLRLSRLGFKHIDRDGTGLINQTEFQVYMLLRQGRVTPAQLRHLDRLFDCMDRDKTGRLSYQEIRDGLMDVDLE
ncbi:TPKC [Symbiodinium necroappetens]|uniref:TPKC protein n=1 Tax=Symbiodinium necroappetens TaxID=1628268 RepID=A0A812REI2_9DINO|nr:TPKC [Symbiodinium necroappetens]